MCRYNESNKSTPLLVWGASSSVGSYAVQLAKIAGVHYERLCDSSGFTEPRALWSKQLAMP